MTLELIQRIAVKLVKAAEYDVAAKERGGEAKTARGKARNLRVSAAIDLRDAKQQVDRGDAGDITWAAWCQRHLPDYSLRRIHRLLRSSAAVNVEPTLKSRPDKIVKPDGPEMAQAKMSLRRLSFEERGDLLDWVRAIGLY